MMDLSRFEELMVRHRHDDGSWGELRPVSTEHHDPASHDPERAWDDTHLFRCDCGEEMAVTVRDTDRRGG